MIDIDEVFNRFHFILDEYFCMDSDLISIQSILMYNKKMYLIKDLYMSLYAFHLRQIVSTDLGKVDHGDQGGNAARTRI